MTLAFDMQFSTVEVLHDGHTARFRAVTVDEQMRIAEWLYAIDALNAWDKAGRSCPMPNVNENATLPLGTEFDSNGHAVIGLNADGWPWWNRCKECVDMGAEALTQKAQETIPHNLDELVKVIVEASLRTENAQAKKKQ